MSKPAVTPVWIELSIDRSGNEIRVSARGSRGEFVPARPLGLDRDTLLEFSAAVARAASRGQSLSAAVIDESQAIQRAVLGGEVSALFARLREASAGPLLVRLLVHDVELQAVPWEALCNAGEALGFWGTSPNVLPVRSVASSEPWQPREVRGAVKVLAIAPTGSAGLANLKQALAARIATGEVEWLDPVEGRAAKVPGILERLRCEPIPHVIHFLGHGGIDDQGRPALRMGDEDDEEKWLPAEVLAQQLASSFRGVLRLIVLEACELAKPSAFASAAEILARAGADAVVAFLWPVRADLARTCSTEFYLVLVADRGAGDVARALNEARRATLGTHESSAEAMSPVVYLRGPDGNIFDFQSRTVAPPRKAVVSSAVLSLIPHWRVSLVHVFRSCWAIDGKTTGQRSTPFATNSATICPSCIIGRRRVYRWARLHNGLPFIVAAMSWSRNSKRRSVRTWTNRPLSRRSRGFSVRASIRRFCETRGSS